MFLEVLWLLIFEIFRAKKLIRIFNKKLKAHENEIKQIPQPKVKKEICTIKHFFFYEIKIIKVSKKAFLFQQKSKQTLIEYSDDVSVILS